MTDEGTYKSAPRTAIHMALNGIFQYTTSAGEIANNTLARLEVSFSSVGVQRRVRMDKESTHPVDRRPIQIIH
jgi:hypothetical protein